MAIFICSCTKLSKCQSLGDQVRVVAMRRGNGWQTIRDDLARLAEEWFGREPARTRSEMHAVCEEVFRTN